MMRTNTASPANIADMYMSVLSSLSVEDRLELISKLSFSIKKDARSKTKKHDLRTMFCGEWGNIDNLRDSAYYGRDVINW